LRLDHRLGRGDQDRQRLRVAAREHGIDRDALDGRRAEARRDPRHHLFAGTARVAQHALDALDRRRHHRQPVAPAPLAVEAVDCIEIVRRFEPRRIRGRLAHRSPE